jgi:hypothetical protein
MDEKLRDYIRILVSEILEENRPAAQQLVRQDHGKRSIKKKEADEDEELEEFSGVGAIQGFTLPLGMSPDSPIMGSKKRKKNPKRKNPSWS